MSTPHPEEIIYQTEETPGGTWRRYTHPTHGRYAEYMSRRRLFGMPLVHYIRGLSPETGKVVTARGVVAIGRRARGIVAIGQLAIGMVAIGQLAVGFLALGQGALGVLLGIGQGAIGMVAAGQLAIAPLFAVGQFAAATIAIGQSAYGHYVLAQQGHGPHVWDMRGADPQAVAFFRSLLPW